MRHLVWVGLLVAALAPALSFAGDVQVSCEPGLRVYLDGKLAGTSTAREDGLFLSGVSRGVHTIRVEKDGFVPQSFEVSVDKLPIEVKVGEFSPLPTAKPGPEAAPAEPPPAERVSIRTAPATGGLLVTSAPQNCTVEIDGRSETKDAPVLRLDGLAVGEHAISFIRPGYERLSGTVRVLAGTQVGVRGDLLAGKVETVFEGKGTLRLTSFPDVCTVHILGKTRETWRGFLKMTYLPAGEHRLIVEWGGRKLETTIMIFDRQATNVAVSFAKGAEPFTVTYPPE